MSDILHIGLHKTGSTYLQNAIWPQVHGVQYLSRPYTQHNQAFNRLQYADDTLYDAFLLRKELSQFETRRFLISDEALSGKPLFFASVNRTQIAKRLCELFPSAIIIIFIRDQIDAIVSHYNSYVKEPVGIKPIREFIWKPGPDYRYQKGLREHDYFAPENLYFNTIDLHLHVDSFLYSPLIQLYRDLFERVEVFLFEDLRSRPNAVITRLSEIVGQKLDPVSERWNRSYSRNELTIRRTLNRVRPLVDSDILIKGVSRVLGSVLPKGRKDIWRTQVEEIVGDYYGEDNRKLKQFCPDLSWDLYEGKYA